MSTADRARLRIDIRRAARLVGPSWPLEHVIAVNPLLGLLDQGFDRATDEARRWLGAPTHPGPGGRPGPTRRPAPRTVLEQVDARDGTALAPAVDREVARWCTHLLDRSGAGADGRGVYAAWRQLTPHDRAVRRLTGRARRAEVTRLPEHPDDAILVALDRLGVGGADRALELRGQLARLPGWAGYAVWCDEWAAPDDPAPRLGLVDLLAVRLSADALSVPPGVDLPAPSAPPPGARPDPGPLEELEAAYRHDLLRRLGPPTPGPSRPEAQVVCCIDVRSEGIRRRLESVGPYDTLGFAGFFAAAVRFRPLGWAEAYPSAPVLVTPSAEAVEVAEDGPPRGVEARRRRLAAGAATHAAGQDPLAMFAMAEAGGWVLGPVALARTLRPGLLEGRGEPVAGTLELGLAVEERSLVAETALRTMGLTRNLAPLVVLCGHRSTSAANAHASSLDCGACGGNRGGPNARILAGILNDPEVRVHLRERDLVIPAGTWFVAGEHDTTTDDVSLFDLDRVPAAHADRLARLQRDLRAAGRSNAEARAARLPAAWGPAQPPASRARDWAQTRPEWGLARNAAFVVGTRDLTRAVDLDGRAFLHSYDAADDDEGTALETILTAPMVVAHWINAQYYFSTVAPEVYGAGDKSLHNPVGAVGVLSGAEGDLRVGLPAQSVFVGEVAYHEPVRLLTVVEAPRRRIEEVIGRNPVLQQLFDGAWVHLVARDRPDRPWARRHPGGGWVDELAGPAA